KSRKGVMLELRPGLDAQPVHFGGDFVLDKSGLRWVIPLRGHKEKPGRNGGIAVPTVTGTPGNAMCPDGELVLHVDIEESLADIEVRLRSSQVPLIGRLDLD